MPRISQCHRMGQLHLAVSALQMETISSRWSCRGILHISICSLSVKNNQSAELKEYLILFVLFCSFEWTINSLFTWAYSSFSLIFSIFLKVVGRQAYSSLIFFYFLRKISKNLAFSKILAHFSSVMKWIPIICSSYLTEGSHAS